MAKVKSDPKRATIKKHNQKDNFYEIKFTITAGEAMSIKHALEMYSEHSPVADDVKCYLRNACLEAEIDLEK